VSEGHIEKLLAECVADTAEHPEGLLTDVIERQPFLRQDFRDVVTMLVGHHRDDLFRREIHALALEFLGADDVHAVRPATHVLVDPGQLEFQLLGGVRGRAQHAEPSGVGDRRHHVAAMTERQ
jgi:hypothetical protein